MKNFDLSQRLNAHKEMESLEVLRHLERLDSMILKADNLLTQIRASTDIDPALDVTAEHLEFILGDLNYSRTNLAETHGPVVIKNNDFKKL